MCLLICASKNRIPEASLRNGNSNHPHGIGVAWHIEDGTVEYKKNITIDEAIEFSKTLPLGHCFHFRYASVGGEDKNLVHPFPISKDVRLVQEGIDKAVLFHNGHFSDWNPLLINHLSTRLTLPKGKWSDTRAIAFLVSIHGTAILDLLGAKAGKFIVMTELENFFFGNFEDVDGVLYSNDSYRTQRTTRGTGLNNSTSNVRTEAGPTVGTPHVPGKFSQPSQPLSSNEINLAARETMTDEEYNEIIAYFKELVPEDTVLQHS